MDKEVAIIGLAALAQSTRLDVFRMLVRHEPDGLPAGQIGRSPVDFVITVCDCAAGETCPPEHPATGGSRIRPPSRDP